MSIKKKSVIPVYGVAASWVLYCVFFPLYKITHFIILVCLVVLVNRVLSMIFPGKTEHVEVPVEPERTGDEKIDALLSDGKRAISEMRIIQNSIPDTALRERINGIIIITEKIFKDLLEDPNDYKHVKRFADYYLPTTIKLLHTYDRFADSGADGENIRLTKERIVATLGTIQTSYEKFFDSLFHDQALDIETDIVVLENMLKQDGLLVNEKL